MTELHVENEDSPPRCEMFVDMPQVVAFDGRRAAMRGVTSIPVGAVPRELTAHSARSLSSARSTGTTNSEKKRNKITLMKPPEPAYPVAPVASPHQSHSGVSSGMQSMEEAPLLMTTADLSRMFRKEVDGALKAFFPEREKLFNDINDWNDASKYSDALHDDGMQEATYGEVKKRASIDSRADAGQAFLKTLTSTAIGHDHTHALIQQEYELAKRLMPAAFVRKVFRQISHYLHDHLHEPNREGPVAQFVDSNKFEFISAMVIAVNAIIMVFLTDHAVEYGRQDVPLWMTGIEMACFTFFVLELLLKLLIHKWYYFFGDGWAYNWLDVVLVAISVGDIAVSGGGYSFIRVVRILKTAKVLRVFRLMRFLSDLRLILNSIIGSMVSLFWSLIMMSLVFYTFALLFVQQTATYLDLHAMSINDDEHAELKRMFGSVEDGMLSLYQAVTGGDDWGRFYAELAPFGRTTRLLFLFFIAFTQIAVLNILTGIFVENAMKCAEPDKEARYLEKVKEQAAEMKELHKLCREIDVDEDGVLTQSEFHRTLYMEDSNLRKRFFEMGLRPVEAERFFALLNASTTDDGVDIESFVSGCAKLKGDATSLDLQTLTFQAKLMHERVKDVQAQLTDLRKATTFRL